MPAPRKPNPPRSPRTPPSSQQSVAPQLIDPRWLIKALGIVLFVALLCAWGTLCLLWYQGQWQLVLHPSRNLAATPAAMRLGYKELHFADDATGQPQLNGWGIAAFNDDVSTRSTPAPVALILHDGSGSMADDLPRAVTLHNAHVGVLLFDYRGFGKSMGQHPTETMMQQDAAAALTFLTSTMHVAPKNIILYGQGLGASLAVQLAAQNQDIGAIILEAPDGDLANRVAHDAHSSLVPVRTLFNEDFPLAAPLRSLKTPKLLVTYGNSAYAALAYAADPKMTVELPSPNDPALLTSITRFLDLYFPTRPLNP